MSQVNVQDVVAAVMAAMQAKGAPAPVAPTAPVTATPTVPMSAPGLPIGGQFACGAVTVTSDNVMRYKVKGDKTSGLVPALPLKRIGKGSMAITMSRFGEVGVPADIFPAGSTWDIVAIRRS